ncbi:hypothetical protein JCM16138_22620 [Thermococcus atlanticus]
MDVLKHISIPMLAFLAITRELSLFLLAVFTFGAIFPDFDVFFDEHRSYFHSLIFLTPLSLLSLWTHSMYLWLFTAGAAFHIFLDFFSGVIPFLYPIKKRGLGIKIMGLVVFESLPRLKIRYRLILGYPERSRGSHTALSNESVAMLIVALAALLLRLST